MSEEAGAAPAAAEPASAPEPSSQAPVTPVRAAIDRAFAKMESEDTGAAQPPRPVSSTTEPVEDKPKEAKPERAEPKEAKPREKTEKAEAKDNRGPDGKFVSTREPAKADAKVEARPEDRTEAGNFTDAPTRFSNDAKAAWKDAPEPVRAEVHRAVKELEAGLGKYKADAESFGELREFAELAKRGNTTLKEAMDRYVRNEVELRRNPGEWFERIARNLNFPLREWAAYLVGQQPNEVAGAQDRIIAGLHQEIANLKRAVSGVSQSMEQQTLTATVSNVEAFSQRPEFARFEELASDIKFFIDSGKVNRNQAPDKVLADAYRLAELLNPASQAAPPAPPPAQVAAPDPKTVQPDKGQLSLTGAPSSGSDPARRKPPATAREAVDRAFATMQIG